MNKQRSLGFMIQDAARLMRRRFDQETRHLDMTSAQLQIMGRLARCEGTNQAQLASLLDMEPITVSRHVDRLEAAGLVERTTALQDRRVKLLNLTAKGKTLLPKMKAVALGIFDDAQQGLSKKERELLLDCLEQVVANLSRRPAEPSVAETRVAKVPA